MIINKIKNLLRTIYQDIKLYNKIKPCLDACDDSLSKSILKIRLNYYSEFLSNYKRVFPWVKSPYFRFHNRINKLLNPIYIIEELELFSGKSIVVFGNGDGYKYTKSLLNRSDWRNNYRCIGDSIEKIKTIKDNEILILAYFKKNNALYDFIKSNYPNIIIYEPNPLLWAVIRNQYFDVFNPKEEEYVVDCGAFDGKTEEQFYIWGSNHIKKIYAFELDPVNSKKCKDYYSKKNLNDIVEFINKGTSNINKTIYLDESSLGSSASREGTGTIKAEIVKLDDAIKDKISFIKMDIEGEELNALIGASKIIQSQKPRLAICLYHKKNDIYEIPLFILSIVKEYRFIVRHYSSNPWETILYAYVPE